MFPKAGVLRWQVIRALAYGSDATVLTNPVDWARLSGTSLAPRLLPIPIGSNIQREPPTGYDRDEQRARWGAGPGDWLLAYFGFLNANKGGKTLVRCLSELAQAGKPARLLMVGGQTGASDPTNVAYLGRVEELIARLAWPSACNGRVSRMRARCRPISWHPTAPCYPIGRGRRCAMAA